MGILALLFIVVPIVELSLLVRIGARIGFLPTVGLVIATGVLGAGLARWQGTGVIRQMKGELLRGHLPAESLVDGAILLVAALLLITPGVLTDLVGLLCLVPPIRAMVRERVWKRVKEAVRVQQVRIVGGDPFARPGDVIIEGESEVVEPHRDPRLQPPRSE